MSQKTLTDEEIRKLREALERATHEIKVYKEAPVGERPEILRRKSMWARLRKTAAKAWDYAWFPASDVFYGVLCGGLVLMKLGGIGEVAAWPWSKVLMPIWIPAAFAGSILVVAAIVTALAVGVVALVVLLGKSSGIARRSAEIEAQAQAALDAMRKRATERQAPRRIHEASCPMATDGTARCRCQR